MSELARVDAARRALAEAETPQEARAVEDKAALLAKALAKHDGNVERANEFAEIAIEAAVKVGQLLPPKQQGRRTDLELCSPLNEVGQVARQRYLTLAASDPDARSAYYAECRDLGDVINKTALLRALGGNPFAKQWSGEPEWYTPPEYIESARRVMGAIDLDPASNEFANRKVRAARYYTAADNGLEHRWSGRVWLNPPYKMPAVRDFCERVVEHVSSGEVEAAIVLTNNATDTQWWHLMTRVAEAVCFTAGRISFYNEDGEHSAPTNGQNFHYFGPDVAAFVREFSDHGACMTRA